MNSQKTTINLIVIKTDKIREQVEFYTALGLEFEHHKHGNGPYHYSTIGHPVLEIYPVPSETQQVDNTTRLGFAVDSLDQIIQNLRGKNIKIIAEPSNSEWGYRAVVQDLDGRKIELTQAKSID